MKNLEGKVAVVTGASKGIGAGIAIELAKAGASVVVNYASSLEGAERVVKLIEADGGRAFAVQADVAKTEDVKRLFRETIEQFGRLDILVNNAGVYKFAPLEGITEEEFRRQFDTNVWGTFLTVREALPYFDAAGGSVINVSSVASQNPPPNASIYSSTKGAVDTLTISLARELVGRNIRVNVIAPGGTESEGVIAAGIKGSDFEKMIIDNTPMGRLGVPEDIAKVAVFLASDQSSWLTGERISASGGAR